MVFIEARATLASASSDLALRFAPPRHFRFFRLADFIAADAPRPSPRHFIQFIDGLHLCSASPPSSRIDTVLPKLPAMARRAGDLRHRRRSGPRDRRRSAEGAAGSRCRSHRIGMPFTDPMADGPAIQAAGLRALWAGTTLTKTLALVADFREADAATPIVLMGYYNPIYVYGVDAFPRRRRRPRRRWPDRRRSAAGGGQRALPAGAEGRAELHPPRHAHDGRRRLPAVLGNASGFVYYVSMTGITGAAAPDVAVGAAVERHQGPYRPAGRGRLRRQERGERRGDRRDADGVVVGSALVDAVRGSLDADGSATRTVRRRADLVRDCRPRPDSGSRQTERRNATAFSRSVEASLGRKRFGLRPAHQT